MTRTEFRLWVIAAALGGAVVEMLSMLAVALYVPERW